MTVPMTERKRQSAIKRAIALLGRQRKHNLRQFDASVKGEAKGSPLYDACWRKFLTQDLELRKEIDLAQHQLPPFVVWRPEWGCLEVIAQDNISQP